MYELSILSDRAPLGDPPDLPSYPLLARPGRGQVGVLEAAFISQVRERIEVNPQMLDSMVLTFEGEQQGADSLVVRAWFCGEREVVRLPVFGYSSAREVVGDVGDVASYVTAMWEMLIFGWEQHVARSVGRVQQTIGWNWNVYGPPTLRGSWTPARPRIHRTICGTKCFPPRGFRHMPHTGTPTSSYRWAVTGPSWVPSSRSTSSGTRSR